MILWISGGKGSVAELISDEAVYRTAPATPGLLNILDVQTHKHTHTHKSECSYVLNLCQRLKKDICIAFNNLETLSVWLSLWF